VQLGRDMAAVGQHVSYTVVWKPSAQRKLAQLWTTGPDRQAITDAANRIDALLKRDPLALGESRSGGVRVYFEPPLIVEFRVSEPDRLVEVLRVGRVPLALQGP